MYSVQCQLKSYSDLEGTSVHNNLLSNIKVLDGVEEIVVRGRLMDAVTADECTYICM